MRYISIIIVVVLLAVFFGISFFFYSQIFDQTLFCEGRDCNPYAAIQPGLNFTNQVLFFLTALPVVILQRFQLYFKVTGDLDIDGALFLFLATFFFLFFLYLIAKLILKLLSLLKS